MEQEIHLSQNNNTKLNLQQDKHEQLVGITEFLNKGQQILGVVKYRFSDFIVNEITRNSKQPLFYEDQPTCQIYDILNFSFANKESQSEQNQINQQQMQDKQNKQGEIIQKEIKDLQKTIQLIGNENAQQIQKLYENWQNGEKITFFKFEIDAPQEKSERIQIHDFIRENLPYFDSTTKNDKIVVKFVENLSKQQKKSPRKKNQTEQIYQFTLFKSNTDTNFAISNLSSYLRIPQKQFAMAGLKDKRGITTQKLTVSNQKTTLEDFVQNIKNYKSKHLFTGDYEVVKQSLQPGDLYGNRFSLGFRLIELSPNKEQIAQNIEKIAKDGFINYYGMQRFGQGEVKSYEIGLHILKKQYKEAADKILFENGLNYQQILDEYKETNDSEKALKQLPKHLRRERDMIKFYKNHGKDNHYECLCSLPRSIKEIYPHAYQSYIWNKLASLRISKFGKKIVIGDIVQTKQQSENQQQFKDNQQNINEQNSEEDPEFSGVNQIQYEYITEDNIDKYEFSDLLIPIIGGKLSLDLNKYNLGSDLINMLDKDGISFEILQQKSRSFFLTGGYRKLIFLVEEMQYKFVKYEQHNQDFQTPFYHKEDDINIENGKYTALILRFTLQKGCYATMFMRELTKVGSSYETQQNLNQMYHSLIQ